jgi:hypothetical protein
MKEDKLMAHDPLSDADTILSEEYYGRRDRAAAGTSSRRATKGQPRPTHYKIICISMYNSDLERLDRDVAELRGRGLTQMSKSRLIRIALAQLDLDLIVAREIP